MSLGMDDTSALITETMGALDEQPRVTPQRPWVFRGSLLWLSPLPSGWSWDLNNTRRHFVLETIVQISGLGVTHTDTECSVWVVAGMGAEMRAIPLASRAKCQPSGLQ